MFHCLWLWLTSKIPFIFSSSLMAGRTSWIKIVLWPGIKPRPSFCEASVHFVFHLHHYWTLNNIWKDWSSEWWLQHALMLKRPYKSIVTVLKMTDMSVFSLGGWAIDQTHMCNVMMFKVLIISRTMEVKASSPCCYSRYCMLKTK